jgi:hypothetical protein
MHDFVVNGKPVPGTERKAEPKPVAPPPKPAAPKPADAPKPGDAPPKK